METKSHITHLIVMACHKRIMHGGVKDTLTENLRLDSEGKNLHVFPNCNFLVYCFVAFFQLHGAGINI